MQLYEIWDQITESWGEYWKYIPMGPLFNYSLGTEDRSAVVLGHHDARAVLLADVRIAIEWGLEEYPFEYRRDYKAEWAPFADPSVVVCFADVYYAGSLVDRVRIANVDGGRAYLPVPKREDDRWVVMDRPYQLVRLINDIMDVRDFDSYFERSGIYKWPA